MHAYASKHSIHLLWKQTHRYDFSHLFLSSLSLIALPNAHLLQCIHYACRLRYECAYLYSKSCSVLSESGTGIVKSNNEKNLVSLGPDGNKISPLRSYVNLSPCPAKYVCSYCLGIPRQQVYGCFDTYNVMTRNPWARDGHLYKPPKKRKSRK